VEHWKHVYDEDVAIHLIVSFVHCVLGYPDGGKKKNGAVNFLNHKNANSGKYEGKPKKRSLLQGLHLANKVTRSVKVF
jgi:hypothetical protein